MGAGKDAQVLVWVSVILGILNWPGLMIQSLLHLTMDFRVLSSVPLGEAIFFLPTALLCRFLAP